ncbi:54S ribosomal protein YmL6, mitochondrial [Candida viswanathii]|uniref:Large ribosomal subunit protein uL4m n=1 Tax=Candida viswanathii TaxID=5486 RepID=A0A367YII5_9ASCO|nr:54S ribosomal protein YmL6, mitochondrial [Candida viswanathii]
MFRTSIRRLATEATTTTTTTSTSTAFHVAQPPSHTLAQLRSFPSLEPTTFLPLPTSFFNTESPLRRDVLWSSVVYEADCARVGSNYVTLKSDSPYSNRKLRPQKGSGRARLGDANSPHMDNEIKAHAIKGPHDWSTALPKKLYALGMRSAFTDVYKLGKLNVVDGVCDFQYGFDVVSQMFVSTHHLGGLNLLFIVDSERQKLKESLEAFFTNEKTLEGLKKREKRKYLRKLKGKVLLKHEVEVRDILRADRVFVELSALQWFITEYGQ